MELIPTFSKIRTRKINFDDHTINQKQKDIKIITDNDFMETVTQQDIECERRNELPYRIVEFTQKRKYKGTKAKITSNNKDNNLRSSFISYNKFNRQKPRNIPTNIYSNEKIIDMYQDFLSSDETKKTNPFVQENIFHSLNADKNYKDIDNKNLLEKKINLFKSKAQIKKTKYYLGSSKSKSKYNKTTVSNLFLTTTNFSKTKHHTLDSSNSLISFKKEQNEKDSDINQDVSIIKFTNNIPSPVLNDKEIIKKKIKLEKILDEVKEFEIGKTKDYNKEKVESNSKLQEPFVRTNFFKTKNTGGLYKKKPMKSNVESKVKQYIITDTIARPVSCKQKFKTFDKIFLQASKKKILHVKKGPEIDLEEIEYKPKNKNNWIEKMENGFKKEIVNYQDNLGFFVYAGLRGYFTHHFDSMTKGGKVYKDALKQLECDWLTEGTKKLKEKNKKVK